MTQDVLENGLAICVSQGSANILIRHVLAHRVDLLAAVPLQSGEFRSVERVLLRSQHEPARSRNGSPYARAFLKHTFSELAGFLVHDHIICFDGLSHLQPALLFPLPRGSCCSVVSPTKPDVLVVEALWPQEHTQCCRLRVWSNNIERRDVAALLDGHDVQPGTTLWHEVVCVFLANPNVVVGACCR